MQYTRIKLRAIVRLYSFLSNLVFIGHREKDKKIQPVAADALRPTDRFSLIRFMLCLRCPESCCKIEIDIDQISQFVGMVFT